MPARVHVLVEDDARNIRVEKSVTISVYDPHRGVAVDYITAQQALDAALNGYKSALDTPKATR